MESKTEDDTAVTLKEKRKSGKKLSILQSSIFMTDKKS